MNSDVCLPFRGDRTQADLRVQLDSRCPGGRLDQVSREDANLVIAVSGLLLAVVATAAAIYAIRRDRADLRVTAFEAALANRYVTVVNVGLRPVRIERVLEYRWSVVPLFGTAVSVNASVASVDADERPLPAIIQPADAVSLHYWPRDDGDFVRERKSYIVVEDASGRRYPVRTHEIIQAARPADR
jgi:hypothetical protein